MSSKQNDGKKTTILSQMEAYLASTDFESDLKTCFSKATRGTPSIISDEILVNTIENLCGAMPKVLEKAIPPPNEDFVINALKSLDAERPKHKCWRTDDVGDIVQMVLVAMAAAVDKFREIGGFEVDATEL